MCSLYEVGEAKMEQTLNPGQSGVFRVTFQEPDTYEMYCPVIGHRLAGMKGEVVVKWRSGNAVLGLGLEHETQSVSSGRRGGGACKLLLDL
jgi:hypothetical protein